MKLILVRLQSSSDLQIDMLLICLVCFLFNTEQALKLNLRHKEDKMKILTKKLYNCLSVKVFGGKRDYLHLSTASEQ